MTKSDACWEQPFYILKGWPLACSPARLPASSPSLVHGGHVCEQAQGQQNWRRQTVQRQRPPLAPTTALCLEGVLLNGTSLRDPDYAVLLDKFKTHQENGIGEVGENDTTQG